MSLSRKVYSQFSWLEAAFDNTSAAIVHARVRNIHAFRARVACARDTFKAGWRPYAAVNPKWVRSRCAPLLFALLP